MIDYFDSNDFVHVKDDDLTPEEHLTIGCGSVLCCVVLIIVGLLICALLGSCSTHKGMMEERKDSLIVQVKEKVVYVKDTTYITIPAQKESVTVKDSASHLENEYATSDARINSDGTLSHSLSTKPQDKPVEFQKPIVSKDSIRTETKWRIRTITKEVERKKTWWEQTRSYGFYVLVILTLFRYRKKLWKLITAFRK